MRLRCVVSVAASSESMAACEVVDVSGSATVLTSGLFADADDAAGS
jgi:hypothetical protein